MRKIILFILNLCIIYSCKDEITEISTSTDLQSTNLKSTEISLSSGLRIDLDLNFGVNGHVYDAYLEVGDGDVKKHFEVIFEKLAEMGITHYRIDFNLFSLVDNEYQFNDNVVNNITLAANCAKEYGITIVPVIYFSEGLLNYECSAYENETLLNVYRDCRTGCSVDENLFETTKKEINELGKDVGSKIQDLFVELGISYIQLDNELTTFSSFAVSIFGSSQIEKDDLNPCLMPCYVSLYNGICEELKGDIRVIIGSAAGYFLGFFDYMQDVDYDILGLNWYSSAGKGYFYDSAFKTLIASDPDLTGYYNEDDYLETLHTRYDKDIWILELNRGNGQGYNDWQQDETESYVVGYDNIINTYSRTAFEKFYDYLNESDCNGDERTSYVKSTFVYELLNSGTNTDDNSFAICYTDGDEIKNFEIANYYEDMIQNGLISYLTYSNSERFAFAVYRHHFNRYPESESALTFSSNLIEKNDNETYIKDIVECNYNPESYTQFLDSLYNNFLDREASDSEINYWYTYFMARGSSREEMISRFCCSTEFYSRIGGGTDAGYIEALYNKLLRRASDTSGKAYHLANLETYSKGYVVSAMMGSTEYNAKVAKVLIRQYLDRDPEGTEVSDYRDQLMNGVTQEELIEELMGTDEFLENANYPYLIPVFGY